MASEIDADVPPGMVDRDLARNALAARVDRHGDACMGQLYRTATVSSIDRGWRDHLSELDSIGDTASRMGSHLDRLTAYRERAEAAYAKTLLLSAGPSKPLADRGWSETALRVSESPEPFTELSADPAGLHNAVS